LSGGTLAARELTFDAREGAERTFHFGGGRPCGSTDHELIRVPRILGLEQPRGAECIGGICRLLRGVMQQRLEPVQRRA
jgi:hypothetical protein